MIIIVIITIVIILYHIILFYITSYHIILYVQYTVTCISLYINEYVSHLGIAISHNGHTNTPTKKKGELLWWDCHLQTRTGRYASKRQIHTEHFTDDLRLLFKLPSNYSMDHLSIAGNQIMDGINFANHQPSYVPASSMHTCRDQLESIISPSWPSTIAGIGVLGFLDGDIHKTLRMGL